MALAEGKSEVRCGTSGLSLHTRSVHLCVVSKPPADRLALHRTAIWLAEQLTDAKFEVEEEASGHSVIRCQGIGYTAPALPEQI